MAIANWSFPTNIKFGCGRISETGVACEELGILRPLIVTDKNLAKSQITINLQDSLSKSGLKVNTFSEVDSNPNEKNLETGLNYLKEVKADGILAFGGGSAIDLAKLLAFMYSQDRPVWDFEDREDWWKRASGKPTLPVIAIPTTAGTGSEVGRASVLTDKNSLTKKIIFHPTILPNLVILDPELTVSMPQEITAGTGMDALAHNLEAYCSESLHPMAHGIALEGMRIVFENLENVYKSPKDLNARGQMMISATMGAVAFQKGLGAVHALSHPIGAKYNCHHGTTNAILINSALILNKPSIEKKIKAACRYLNFEETFDSFCGKIDALNSTLHIPKNLGAMGVKISDVQNIVNKALIDPSTSTNPVILNKDNLAETLIRAI